MRAMAGIIHRPKAIPSYQNAAHQADGTAGRQGGVRQLGARGEPDGGCGGGFN